MPHLERRRGRALANRRCQSDSRRWIRLRRGDAGGRGVAGRGDVAAKMVPMRERWRFPVSLPPDVVFGPTLTLSLFVAGGCAPSLLEMRGIAGPGRTTGRAFARAANFWGCVAGMVPLRATGRVTTRAVGSWEDTGFTGPTCSAGRASVRAVGRGGHDVGLGPGFTGSTRPAGRAFARAAGF